MGSIQIYSSKGKDITFVTSRKHIHQFVSILHIKFLATHEIKLIILVVVKSSMKSDGQEDGESKAEDDQEKKREENADDSKRSSDSDKSEASGESAIDSSDVIMV